MEFTIRQKSTAPIATLKPAVLAQLLNARPEASSLVLTKWKKDYLQLTGKRLSLDWSQKQAILNRYGASESGQWTSLYSQLPAPWYQIQRHFVDGFLQSSLSQGLLKDLEVAQAFYDWLAPLIPRSPS